MEKLTDASLLQSTRALAARVRKSLLATARASITLAGANDAEIAVPMSSGVDSHCALFTQLVLGQSPTVFSFRLDDRESRDFIVARRTAQEFGLDFVEVRLPTSLTVLKADTHRLARLGARSKTDFECFWPMLYLLPSIQAHGCKLLFTGHGADSLFCMSRKASQHFKGNEDAFRDAAFSNKKAFQRHLIDAECARLGLVYSPIFYTQSMRAAFAGVTSDVMHKPIEKAGSRYAFPELFDRVRVYTHTSFQLGDSGIQEHFQRLLTTEMNPGGRYKSTRGVFNSVIANCESSKHTKGLFYD